MRSSACSAVPLAEGYTRCALLTGRWLRMSASENAWAHADPVRAARVDLAACHRLAAQFGLNEGIDNHLTCLVPGRPGRFLLAPFGLLWSEVRAGDFMELDFAGRVVAG